MLTLFYCFQQSLASKYGSLNEELVNSDAPIHAIPFDGGVWKEKWVFTGRVILWKCANGITFSLPYEHAWLTFICSFPVMHGLFIVLGRVSCQTFWLGSQSESLYLLLAYPLSVSFIYCYRTMNTIIHNKFGAMLNVILKHIFPDSLFSCHHSFQGTSRRMKVDPTLNSQFLLYL